MSNESEIKTNVEGVLAGYERKIAELEIQHKEYELVRMELDAQINIYEDIGEVAMIEVGKKKAGRKLDGKIWDEYPA